MNFEEHAGKARLLKAGIPVPDSELCTDVEEVAAAVERLGPAAVKAQVATGKRGKAGGIRLVEHARDGREAASAILGMQIDGHRVERVLVEAQISIKREFYAAVLNDVASRAPMILFSTAGGMDIEEIAAEKPAAIHRIPVAIDNGIGVPGIVKALRDADIGSCLEDVAQLLAELYELYCRIDAELIEINPLALVSDGRLLALDCKLTVDNAALYRQQALAERGAEEPVTALEARARELGLIYIELQGNVGVLANGAGLTMTTMDVISHCGGSPANFLEIGGDAYTKATPALKLALDNTGVKSLIVNFCGAFARTDVMAQGVIDAWESLQPHVPVFFSIHGTGEDEAVRLVTERLGIEPFDHMEDAVQAAVEAAQ